MEPLWHHGSSPRVEQRPRTPDHPPRSTFRLRSLSGGPDIVSCAFRPLALHQTYPLAHHPSHTSPFLDLELLLLRRNKAMHSPVVHHSLFVVELTSFLCLRPLIAVELAVTLAPGTFLAGLVPVCLHPAGFTSAAVDPAGMAFAEEKTGTDVVTWSAVAGDV